MAKEDKRLVDYLKRESEDIPLGVSSEDQSNQRTIIAGVAPLLAGVLSGNMEDATKIGGKALVGEDQRMLDENKSLLDYLRKKQSAESKVGKRFQFLPTEDEAGNITYGVADTFTGGIKPTEHIRGYSPFLATDPRTGELARVAKGKRRREAEAVPMEGEATPSKDRFNVKQEKDLRDLRKSFMQDPEVKAARKSIESANRAIELLQSENPISDEGIKTIFPRMFGEVGNLSAPEQERYSGSQSFPRRFERLAEKARKGLLTVEDRADLLEVARVMAAYSRQSLQNLYSKYSKSEAALTGIEEGQASSVISPMTELTEQTGAVQERVKKTPIQGQTIERMVNGRLRKLRKVKGGWELVD